MLEHLPEWLGHAIQGWRAGADQLVVADPAVGTPVRIDLTSAAFADGGRLPDRFTEDGDGASPPLAWTAPPAGATTLALIVEDADSPTPHPLVHAVLWGLPADAGSIPEGALREDAVSGGEVGRNSFRRRGWLPPDPPTGHGEHRYVFQLFALGPDAPVPAEPLGRSSLVEAMRGHVLAAGLLTGTYSRAEPAATGPVGAATTA